MDSDDKNERLLAGPVSRSVVFLNPLLECNKKICSDRGYSMKETYLKFAGDSGAGSFKYSMSLINLANDLNSATSDGPSSSKKQKWSYEEGVMAEDFKDTGVRRIIVASWNNSQSQRSLHMSLGFHANHVLN